MLAIGVILGGYWKGLSSTDFLDSFVATLPMVGRAISAVLVPTLAGSRRFSLAKLGREGCPNALAVGSRVYCGAADSDRHVVRSNKLPIRCPIASHRSSTDETRYVADAP